MLDSNRIMSLTFLSYNGEMSGDHFGMRYLLKKTVKELEELDEKGKNKTIEHLQAYVWPDPFCFDKTPEADKILKEFEFSQEGRLDAIEWLQKMYDDNRNIWDNAPRVATSY